MANGILFIYDNTTSSWINYTGLISYKVGLNKLWSPDTGRSMTGENKGTLIGIFPKLECQIGRQSAADRAVLLRLLMKPRIHVRYFDPAYNTTGITHSEGYGLVDAYFYANDQTDEMLNSKTLYHGPLNFNLIANSKRTVSP